MGMFQEHPETLLGVCGLSILWECSFKAMKFIYTVTTSISYAMAFRQNG